MFIIKKVMLQKNNKELIFDVAITDTEKNARLYMLKHQPLNTEVKVDESTGIQYPYYFYNSIDMYDPYLDDEIETIDSDHVFMKDDEAVYKNIQPSLITVEEKMGIEIEDDKIKTYTKSDIGPLFNRHEYLYDLAEVVKVFDVIYNKINERRKDNE